LVVRYQLGIPTTALLIFLLIVGLRDRIPVVEKFLDLPPHYMQFNMYVWDLKSPTSSSHTADFYVPAIKKNFTSDDLHQLQPTLGALIQGDRWIGFQPAIQKYFCNIKDTIGVDQSSFEVVSTYIRNSSEEIRATHVINCN